MEGRSSPSVRSIHSKIATSVRFINRSESHVKVLWLNYQGEQVLYSTLEPSSGYYDVNTFVTHPWIAVEEETSHRMLLNSRHMYFPTPPEIGHSEADAENHISSSVMTQVIITPNGMCWDHASFTLQPPPPPPSTQTSLGVRHARGGRNA